MQRRYYVDRAGADPDGFFAALPGWVVLDTEGFGTRARPWAQHYSEDRAVADALARVLNRIEEGDI